eukprot:10473144-Karenia_brevis.AAC.1
MPQKQAGGELPLKLGEYWEDSWQLGVPPPTLGGGVASGPVRHSPFGKGRSSSPVDKMNVD